MVVKGEHCRFDKKILLLNMTFHYTCFSLQSAARELVERSRMKFGGSKAVLSLPHISVRRSGRKLYLKEKFLLTSGSACVPCIT